MNNDYRLGLLMVSLTALNWAILPLLLKYAFQFIGLGTLAFFRFSMSFVLLFVYLSLRGRFGERSVVFRPPRGAIVAGLLLAINYYGYMGGVKWTSASNAQIFIQLSPLLLALYSLWVLGERIKRLQLWGLILLSLGLLIFYQQQLKVFMNNLVQYHWGNLLIFMAALSWVGYAILQKKLSINFSPQSINLIIYLVASLAFFPSFQWRDFVGLSWIAWIVVILLGINTLLAYGALGEALKRLPAYVVSAVIVINPLGTLLLLEFFEWQKWAWIAYEPLSLWAWLGAVLMLAGVVMVLLRGVGHEKNTDR